MTGKVRVRRIIFVLLLLLVMLFCFSPTFVRRALVYWYPDISDTYLFVSDTVRKADDCWEWPLAAQYNRDTLTHSDHEVLDHFRTVAFLVIQYDSILYEEYRGGWDSLRLSNIFSATKSIVGLLTGIAFDEGYIKSLDDNVGKYIPEFDVGDKKRITVRHLLTMSSGLNWDEAYTSLFSKTTEAYYGDQIRKLVMQLEPEAEPGKKFSYKSGDTQLLSFVVEAATGMTISKYAEEKLWKPMQVCNNALWNLDKKGGDEKSYCCFNSTARDMARFGRLILNNGNWEGRQIISEAYLQEAIRPASYLRNQFGDGDLDYYGFQIWIMNYKGMSFPVFRGLDGQYVYIIPQKNAIVVRLGHKRSATYNRERTIDMDIYLDVAFEMLK